MVRMCFLDSGGIVLGFELPQSLRQNLLFVFSALFSLSPIVYPPRVWLA